MAVQVQIKDKMVPLPIEHRSSLSALCRSDFVRLTDDNLDALHSKYSRLLLTPRHKQQFSWQVVAYISGDVPNKACVAKIVVLLELGKQMVKEVGQYVVMLFPTSVPDKLAVSRPKEQAQLEYLAEFYGMLSYYLGNLKYVYTMLRAVKLRSTANAFCQAGKYEELQFVLRFGQLAMQPWEGKVLEATFLLSEIRSIRALMRDAKHDGAEGPPKAATSILASHLSLDGVETEDHVGSKWLTEDADDLDLELQELETSFAQSNTCSFQLDASSRGFSENWSQVFTSTTDSMAIPDNVHADSSTSPPSPPRSEDSCMPGSPPIEQTEAAEPTIPHVIETVPEPTREPRIEAEESSPHKAKQQLQAVSHMTADAAPSPSTLAASPLKKEHSLAKKSSRSSRYKDRLLRLLRRFLRRSRVTVVSSNAEA